MPPQDDDRNSRRQYFLKGLKIKLPRLRTPDQTKEPAKDDEVKSAPDQTPADQNKDHVEVPVAEAEQTKTGETSSPPTAPAITAGTQPRLYVYCVVPSTAPKDFGKIGVEGNPSVYTIEYKDLAAVISEFPGDKFDKNNANTLLHQRVVQKVFEKQMGVPIQFGTIAADKEDVTRLLEQGYEKYKEQLAKLSPAAIAANNESSEPTDVIAEILAQSAASAVRIRQLTDDLDSVRRRDYEKGAERMADGTAKKLLEFLARAPPGAYQASETPAGASGEQMQKIQERLDTLADQISYLVKKTSEQNGQDLESIRKNQERIEEAIEKMTTISEKNVLVVEKTVMGTLRDYFDHVPPAIEAFVLKTVRDSSNVQIAPTRSVGRTERPVQSDVSSHTMCAWCGVEIPKIARFCDRCGQPNTYLEGTVS